MEQRALLASALVLGCVTAAGAGGYLAVRQVATPAPAEPAGQVAAGPEAAAPDPTEGTVAEIAAPVATDVPAKADSAATAVETPAPAVSRPAPAPAPVAVERPALPKARQAQSPAAVPAPSRSTGTVQRPSGTVQHDAPAATPRSTPSVARTTPEATPTTSAPRSDEPVRDTWPSRDAGTTPDDRWATRDAGNGSSGGYGSSAETPLPSRTPVNEPSTPPAPVRRLETVTIPADAVIGIQLEKGVSTATARVEDQVRARVTRDLIAGGDVVIPSGARLLGNVTLVEEGGKVKERARLGIRFHTLVLANGTEVKLPTETIYRDGESPAGRSAAKIGGAAVGGAILGAIMGGGKGAVIGAATGAGSGTGWAMAGDRQPAELRAGQSLTVRVSDSVTTQIER
jgi:hypothetical protein